MYKTHDIQNAIIINHKRNISKIVAGINHFS